MMLLREEIELSLKLQGPCFLRPFGCHVMILNTLDHLGKFNAKGDEGYFVGYSLSSKAFRVFNKRTKKIEENLHVDFLENQPIEKGSGTLLLTFQYKRMFANQTMYENCSTLRFIALLNWFHEAQMATSIDYSKKNDDSQKEQDRIISNYDALESSGDSNSTATAKDTTANQVEFVLSLTVETKVPTVSSLVPTDCLSIPPVSSSGPRIISRGGSSYQETPSLGNAMSLENRLGDLFGDTTASVSLNEVEADLRNMETNIQVSSTPTLRIHKVYPKSQIIGLVDTLVQTRQKTKNMEEQSFIATIYQNTNPELLQYFLFSCFLSQEEPKKIFDALKDPSWVEAMQEELLQFKIPNVWVLVDCPKGPMLPIWALQSTRWMLKVPFYMGLIDEEVYVEQPPDYNIHILPDRVLSGLTQRYHRPDIIYQKAQRRVFANNDAASVTKKDVHLSHKTINLVDNLKKFGTSQMVSDPWIGSLMGLILTATRPESHVCPVNVPGHPKLGLWYPKESPLDLVAYSDNDYGGATQDRKSTTRGCQFLGRRLISWQCKKQTIVATSTTEPEYVAAASGCGQVL
ncbi:uncharacterized mitochondrial protein-like protein [Tanacetum coccineum]